jgi:hypothetical protein
MITRQFTVFSLKKEAPIKGSGKDAKTEAPRYTVGLAEDSTEINHFSFGLEVSEEEAITLHLGATFTLTLNS